MLEKANCYFPMPSITRRDFFNGTALAIASGLTPAVQFAAAPTKYPPSLTGMRGQHPGSFEVAHAFAREGRRDTGVEERYDLVVVGGESAGLPPPGFIVARSGRMLAFSFSTTSTILVGMRSAMNLRLDRAP